MNAHSRDVDGLFRRIHKSDSHALFARSAALQQCKSLVLGWDRMQLKAAAVRINNAAFRNIIAVFFPIDDVSYWICFGCFRSGLFGARREG
jgi:hypothetical protein